MHEQEPACKVDEHERRSERANIVVSGGVERVRWEREPMNDVTLTGGDGKGDEEASRTKQQARQPPEPIRSPPK